MNRKTFSENFLTIMHLVFVLTVLAFGVDLVESEWSKIAIFGFILLGATAITTTLLLPRVGFWLCSIFYIGILLVMGSVLFKCLGPWLSQGTHGIWHILKHSVITLLLVLPLFRIFYKMRNLRAA